MKKQKQEKRIARHKRIKAKTIGNAKCPRLCVFRSNKHVYAQLIDDEKGKTLVSANDNEIKKLPKGKVAIAQEVGKLLAEKAKDLPAGKQVEKVIFDRAGYKYHGRIKSLADGARMGGLKF
ncbi:50S ribosomal protein L18 [Patescibacteria group bacterium]|nr:50S ribosomal protein L18 [Patescibacteria group bacterium]MBU4458449.1 50S ribosomal protein L18 [Patescibacteria group bacterium]MCG2695979.1 50S ribosomal protein L18 [Candidatus Portnoybacteria bacterium]